MTKCVLSEERLVELLSLMAEGDRHPMQGITRREALELAANEGAEAARNKHQLEGALCAYQQAVMECNKTEKRAEGIGARDCFEIQRALEKLHDQVSTQLLDPPSTKKGYEP